MDWVRGEINVKMIDGRIIATTLSRKTMKTDRPKTFEESGADYDLYQRLRGRAGNIRWANRTFGFMGGAIAWLLPTGTLELLPENLMPRLEAFNRELLSDLMYIALVRNAGAPTIQFCAEPAGGMPEDADIDWRFEMLDEGTELGIYNDEGWLGFQLPEDLKHYQTGLDEKQADWWHVVRPDLERIGWVQVEFLPIGSDTLDGERGIICSCLTAGEFSFLKIGKINLEGTGWKLCDLECRKAEHIWQPLNRAIVGIVPRENMSPMLYRFSQDGGLDECGPHFPLSGEVVDYALSHLSIPLLGLQGLN